MQPLEPTGLVALKVWWAFYWRSVLVALAITMSVSFVFGIVLALAGVKADRMMALISGVFTLVLVPAFVFGSVKGMQWALAKKFSDFEIALVPRQD